MEAFCPGSAPWQQICNSVPPKSLFLPSSAPRSQRQLNGGGDGEANRDSLGGAVRLPRQRQCLLLLVGGGRGGDAKPRWRVSSPRRLPRVEGLSPRSNPLSRGARGRRAPAFGRRGRQGSLLLVMYIYFFLVSPKLCYLFTYLKLASWIAEYVIIEHIYLNTLLHLLGEIKKEFHAYLKSIS